MPFFSKPELQDQLVQLGIRLDKKRGQCFLIDENIIRLTVKNANLRLKQDIVIEIGPGLGPLSDYLIEQSKRVFLIEFDKKIAQFLFSYYKSQFQHESQVLFLEDPKKKDYQNLPEDCKVIIIHGDALKVPFPRATKIVSNIPYQISAPLIFKILENWTYNSVILMVQSEFAERLVANVNSHNYSRISAAINLFLNVHKIHMVPPTCFSPPPRVNSMIIELTEKKSMEPDALEWIHRTDFLVFLRGIFPFKNKSIRKALKFYFKNSPHTKKLLNPLYQLTIRKSDDEEIPLFLQRKVRSFSSEELFTLIEYGFSSNSELLNPFLQST